MMGQGIENRDDQHEAGDSTFGDLEDGVADFESIVIPAGTERAFLARTCEAKTLLPMLSRNVRRHAATRRRDAACRLKQVEALAPNRRAPTSGDYPYFE
jgi:hypothetical protein